MYANFAIDDVFVSHRGNKTARVKNGDGGSFVFIPDAHLRVPFEPSTFDKDPKANRQNIVLELTPEAEKLVREFDAWCINYLTEHSERLFKKALSKEKVQAGYSSCIKTSDKGYAPTLKCKMDITGPKQVCCWDENGESVDKPQQWCGRHVKCRLLFSHIYFMGASFGPVIRLTDAGLTDDADEPPKHSCPF
jgi:hypothetical protein